MPGSPLAVTVADTVGPAEIQAAFDAEAAGAADLADRLRVAFPMLVELERDPGLATSEDSVAMGAVGLMSWANAGLATVWHDRFLCAFAAATTPLLVLDDAPLVAMTRIPGTDLYAHVAPVTEGATHCYEISVDGVSRSARATSLATGPTATRAAQCLRATCPARSTCAARSTLAPSQDTGSTPTRASSRQSRHR